jgi:hypothetical protein
LTNEETGEMIILDFNQVLWYGKKMPISLINPNQRRDYGLQLCDDITDKNSEFGIGIDEDTIVPFTMEGTTIYRVPAVLWEMKIAG